MKDGNNMENMTDIIELTGDDGEKFEVEVIEVVEVGENEYFIVRPVEEEDVFTALKVEYDEEGNELFSTVESDEEIQSVEEAYNLKMMDEEEN